MIRSWVAPSICRQAGHSVWAAVQAAVRTMSSGADVMEYDVCIVGAGPAGLSAAIKIKQLCAEQSKDVSVCVVEKGAEVGSHILSGNVFEPKALDELLPDWSKDESCPVKQPATRDRFYVMTGKSSLRLPVPRQMHNKGNYVISLSQLTRWLGTQAENLGVEIYPGFAARHVLYNWDGSVSGIATNDFGVAKDGSQKDAYTPGVQLQAKATLFAEGCRGSLSQEVMRRYQLRAKANACPQTYALGLKEVWQVAPEQHQAGLVWHTVGYPVDNSTWGGGFLYHMGDNNMVSLGYVVGLDYTNPYLSPYQEFQKWKSHPLIKKVLQGGTCLEYGARTLNEGGIQSIPKLTFPGGALVGCSAGFLNVPKIKGSHTAMKSGMLAGQAAFQALTSDAGSTGPVDLSLYQEALENSWVWEELDRVRNIRPAFHFGLVPGLLYSAVDTYLLGGKAPWTLKHRAPDHERLQPAAQHRPIDYPPPDGEITFDIPSSLFRSGTNHDHDQPAHLQLKDPTKPEAVNFAHYAGPESRYCPAGVYEYSKDETTGRPQLQINAQNCLHCKACDIKDLEQNIKWTVPEGGGGPNYTVT